jgi:uncharacterized protein YbdZ (MbtH family)
MQRYSVFFIIVNVLGGFSAHHQQLKNYTQQSGIWQACLLLPLAWVLNNAASSCLYLKEYINDAWSHKRQIQSLLLGWSSPFTTVS